MIEFTDVVKSYSEGNFAASDKHLFDLWECLNFLNQPLILAVIDLEVFARGGSKALAVCAYPVLQLFVAGGIAEIGSGAAYVVNVALKAGKLRDLARFLHHTLNAS